MRLTNVIRFKIIENAVSRSGLREKQKNIEDSMNAKIEEIRFLSVGSKTELEIKKLIKKSSEVLSSVRDCIDSANIRYAGGISISAPSFKTYTYKFKNVKGESELRPVANYYYDYRREEGKKSGSDYLFFEEKLKQRDEVISKISKLNTEVMNVLKQHNTVSSLLKQWPEAKELIPDPKAKTELTILDNSKLNELLRLK